MVKQLKYWIIPGTERHSHSKEHIKQVRKKLNKAAGVDEDSKEFQELTDKEKTSKRVYHISKGPDHPRLLK